MDAPSRTAVYVDGYNLYYGRIRGTRFKWLDIVGLFEHLLHDQDPTTTMTQLRYFTAPALARFATHGDASVLAQQDYHRALQRLHGDRFSIAYGTHAFERGGTLLPRFTNDAPYDRNDRVRVWKIEEKHTDVNLALSIYRDAATGAFGQLVVCSNDSDAAPVLAAIRSDFPGVRLGVVAPIHPPANAASPRRIASMLSRHAHWTRHYLLDAELNRALLPDRVSTRRKPIRRPPHW